MEAQRLSCYTRNLVYHHTRQILLNISCQEGLARTHGLVSWKRFPANLRGLMRQLVKREKEGTEDRFQSLQELFAAYSGQLRRRGYGRRQAMVFKQPDAHTGSFFRCRFRPHLQPHSNFRMNHQNPPPWKIGFFVHHQGTGHAKRCLAIIEQLKDCDVTIFSASDAHFEKLPEHVRFILIPDMISAPARVVDSIAQETPETLHCVPLGVNEVRQTFAAIARWADETDPHLLFIDVSAELAIFARILSLPAVKVRMHGDRNDAGHRAAYESCVGMLAPYHHEIEDPDFPDDLRAKTFYSGGLCTTTELPLSKEEARTKLGLPQEKEIILAINGAGGKGTSYASLTLGARARPKSLWLTVGQIFKEGHETDFPNLKNLGWVEHGQDYIAAADVVIASGGDNTVTEIARMRRPFICIPEWRYFNEQLKKAEVFRSFGAAVSIDQWPGTLSRWNELMDEAYALDLETQARLFDKDAAKKSAHYLTKLCTKLWTGGQE